MTKDELRYRFARLNIAEKLIVINVLLFILNGLSGVLFGYSFSRWFQLPKSLGDFFSQPWSLITYSFFHSGLGHIFWNMFMLYFASQIFLNLFDKRRFINVYALGVIVGGLVFLLSYNLFPNLMNTNAALIGASAGVTAILIFVCAYLPNREVRVVFFNIKLWHLGAFFVLVDLIQIASGGQVGGRLAHLGGALIGYIYAKQLIGGKDIGVSITKSGKSLFGTVRNNKKKTFMRTVYRNRTSQKKQEAHDKASRQHKIDAILDKISKSGYESLSQIEKDFLFKMGKED